MPVYQCYRGDVDNLPLTETNVFFLTDDQGRRWVCRETGLPDLSQVDPIQYALEITPVQQLSHKAGHSRTGSAVVLMDCENREQLRAELGKERSLPE